MSTLAGRGVKRAGLLIVLGLLACCRTPEPSWRVGLGYRQAEAFRVRVGRYGYPYVKVGVNGRPVEVVFDTGNMTGLTLSRDTAEELGLLEDGSAQMYDSGGSETDRVRRFRVDRLGVFGEELRQQHAVEQLGDLPGLLGPPLLQNRRFTLDYEAGLLAVSESPLPKDARAGSALPLVWSSRLPGLVVVRGIANGQPVLVELDTGKSRTTVDGALVTRLGLQKAGWRAAWRPGVTVPDLQLGPHKFSVPSAKVVSLSGISDGLPEPIAMGVGSDILSQVVFTVDYRERIAYLMARNEDRR